jgi:hypothetical protein
MLPFTISQGRLTGHGTQVRAARVRLCHANCGVGLDNHSLQNIVELLALADEEPVSGEAINGGYGPADFIGQWTNDRNMREVGSEFDRNRGNQAGLNPLVERFEKVGKGSGRIWSR